MARLMRQIQELTASTYDVTLTELLSHNRSKNMIMARQVAMYVARMVIGASYPELGKAFDRDHTTIIQAVRRVTKRRIRDPYLDNTVSSIMKQVMRSEVSRSTVTMNLSGEVIARIDKMVGTLWGDNRQSVAEALITWALMQQDKK